MRKFPFLLVMVLLAAGVSGQGGNSPADKTLQAFSKWYAVDAADSIYGLFNDMMKSKVTADGWKQMFPMLKATLGKIGEFRLDKRAPAYAVFVAPGTLNSLDLQLALDTAGHIGGLYNRPSAAGASIKHTNYKVATGDGELAGELLVPTFKAGHKPVVALIIAGSGPTDRDGNSLPVMRTDCYKMLASSLEQRGIASLRYDKRFIGESSNFTEAIDSVRFEDYVNDARACIRRLKADTNFSSVVVIGHSEGSLIGAIAAREEKAAGFVSLAGAGVPAEVILRRQLGQSGLAGAGVERALDSLKKGNERYIASWNRYDPAVEFAKLKMPLLIIQGLTDLQVSRVDAEKLKAAAPKGKLVLIDSMNHVLKDAPADRAQNIATYNNDKLPLNQELVRTIAAFIGAGGKERL